MFKKIVIFFSLTAVIFFSGCNKKSVEVPLPISEGEIEEAIEFGIKNAELSPTEIASNWTVNLGYGEGKGSATLITPFLRTALLAKQAQQMGQQVRREVIEKALTEDADMIVFEVLLFGGYPQFGRSVKFLLKYDKKEFMPVYTFIPSYSEMGRDYTQIVKSRVKFKKTDIPSDAKVVLWIQFNVEPEGKEKYTCEFDFDLSKYR